MFYLFNHFSKYDAFIQNITSVFTTQATENNDIFLQPFYKQRLDKQSLIYDTHK